MNNPRNKAIIEHDGMIVIQRSTIRPPGQGMPLIAISSDLNHYNCILGIWYRYRSVHATVNTTHTKEGKIKEVPSPLRWRVWMEKGSDGGIVKCANFLVVFEKHDQNYKNFIHSHKHTLITVIFNRLPQSTIN